MILDPFNRDRRKLSLAIASGNTEEILNFVRKDISWLTKPLDSNKETLLHKIAASGNADALGKIIKILDDLPNKLSKKKKYAIFNSKTRNGSTPLHVATQYEQIIKLLLTQNADVHLTNQDDRTPFDNALLNNHLENAPLVFNNQLPLTNIVMQLIKSGNVAGLAKLYELTSLNGAVPNWLETDYELKDINSPSKYTGKAIHLAAASDQPDVIEFIISKLGSNNTVNHSSNGTAPLHFAAAFGCASAVEVLIKHGADININLTGSDPLTMANYHKKDKVVDILLQNNVSAKSIDIATKKGLSENPLSLKKFQLAKAIKEGNLEVLKQYVEGEAAKPGNLAWLNVTLKWSYNGKIYSGNPIHFAAASGKVEIIQYIMSKLNNDVINKIVGGWSPLHYAARGGHNSVVEFLLAKKANPNILTPSNHSALSFAVSSSNETMIESLLQNGVTAKIIEAASNLKPKLSNENLLAKKKKDLMNALINGNLTALKLLVEGDGIKPGNPEWLKINFESINESKHTGQAIHVAANYGKDEILRYILDNYGRNLVNSPSKNGMTPLHFAALQGKNSIIKILLEKQEEKENQTDVNGFDRSNYSPLFYAVLRDHKNEIQLLLDNGAKLGLKNKQGKKAAELICPEGKLNEIQIRMDILAKAIKDNEIEVVKKFAAQNREWLIEPLTQHGSSALTLAILSGNRSVTTFILNEFKKEPIVNLKKLIDNRGGTPKYYAALKDSEFFLKELSQFEVQNEIFQYQQDKIKLNNELAKLNQEKFKIEMRSLTNNKLVEADRNSLNQLNEKTIEIVNKVKALDTKIEGTRNQKIIIQDLKKTLNKIFISHAKNMKVAQIGELIDFLPNPSYILDQKEFRNRITKSDQLVHIITKNPSSVAYLFEDNRLFEILINAVRNDKNLLKKIFLSLPLSTIQKQEHKLAQLWWESTSIWKRIFLSKKKQMDIFIQEIANINTDESNLLIGHVHNFGLFNQPVDKINAVSHYDKILLTETNKNLYVEAKYERANIFCSGNSDAVIEIDQIKNARSTFAQIIEAVADEDVSEFLNNTSDLNENVDLARIGEEMKQDFQRMIPQEQREEEARNGLAI